MYSVVLQKYDKKKNKLELEGIQYDNMRRSSWKGVKAVFYNKIGRFRLAIVIKSYLIHPVHYQLKSLKKLFQVANWMKNSL